jgi:hypothetical protein
MNIFLKIVTILLVMYYGNTSYCQTFWGNTKSGMSVEEVKSILPSTTAPDKPKILNGSIELLRLEGITLLGEKYTSSFYFKNKKLQQVSLLLKKDRKFEQLLDVFNELFAALSIKYGNEMSKKIEKNELAGIAEATWISGRTNITVFTTAILDFDGFLNIVYQTRIADASNNL